VGIGDNLMATGMARGAAKRGVKIAFGCGRKLRWDQHSAMVFANNPNIARPGHERNGSIKWIAYHKGNRLYNTHDPANNRWIWNHDFRPIPGEMFFSNEEARDGKRHGKGFVVIEPEVVTWKSSSANKDWGRAKYQQVARVLKADGHRIIQFCHEKTVAQLEGVEHISTRGFRDALAILSHAHLLISPEGGLHHGAAAVDVPAVVLFGGFIPPSVTGYENAKNLTGGAEACGSLQPCAHCRQAMNRITVEEVVEAARDVSEWTR
jgi:ADP-heptose:LPS heptosyltransferase